MFGEKKKILFKRNNCHRVPKVTGILSETLFHMTKPACLLCPVSGSLQRRRLTVGPPTQPLVSFDFMFYSRAVLRVPGWADIKMGCSSSQQDNLSQHLCHSPVLPPSSQVYFISYLSDRLSCAPCFFFFLNIAAVGHRTSSVQPRYQVVRQCR